MGAYAPMTSLSSDEFDDIMERIVDPPFESSCDATSTIAGPLRRDHVDLERPKILEYNARFGDPETQALVPLYGDGLFDLLLAVGEGRLDGSPPVASGAAVT